MTCEHKSFIAETRVGRAEDSLTTEWAVDLRVRCAGCDLPFRFTGELRPARDWKTVRLSIEPAYLVSEKDAGTAMIPVGGNA